MARVIVITIGAIGLSALTAAVASPNAAREAKLTSKNSVVAPLSVREDLEINGVGCGVPASSNVTVPVGATDVKVKRPLPGTRDLDAAISAATVQGNLVTFTAVADGADTCDPGVSSVPPAERIWSAIFSARRCATCDAQIGFNLRVGVVTPRDIAGKTRPKRFQIALAGEARGIRWKSFGGRKAVGYGRFRSLIPCAGGCSDNGTRLKVVLTRPVHCPGEALSGHKEDAVFYEKAAFVLRKRMGVLKPGTEWISRKWTCIPPAPRRPIRVP